DPARSNFIVPAVLRRGDLVVTVSTSGVAPALAARLRDFIGEILGDEYAEVLDRLRLAREELKSRYPDFEERREAWYRLLDTEILPALQRGERPRANTDEDGRARLQPSRYGTTKARASAPEGPHQLVMTDTSAAKASLLDTCSSGTAEPAPSRVTDAPRSADESGKEIATVPVAERGIAFEVVPGVSSATAVQAFAGIPLTQRGISSSFAVVTGHGCGLEELPDFAAILRHVGTLVILMGVGNLSRIAARLLAGGT